AMARAIAITGSFIVRMGMGWELEVISNEGHRLPHKCEASRPPVLPPSHSDVGRCHLHVVLTESSDAQLVERTLAGDTSAYAELVRRYRRAALARALAALGEQPEAEDVAQESFVQAYDQLGTCRDPPRSGPCLPATV